MITMTHLRRGVMAPILTVGLLLGGSLLPPKQRP